VRFWLSSLVAQAGHGGDVMRWVSQLDGLSPSRTLARQVVPNPAFRAVVALTRRDRFEPMIEIFGFLGGAVKRNDMRQYRPIAAAALRGSFSSPAPASTQLRWLRNESPVPSKPECQGQQKDSKYQGVRADPQNNGQRTDTRCKQDQNAKQQREPSHHK
jgi:hypothetical protein